jgi:hypothetical protein
VITNQQKLDQETTEFRAAIETLKLVAADGVVRDFSFTDVYPDGAALLNRLSTQNDWRGQPNGIKGAALVIINRIEREIKFKAEILFGSDPVVATDVYQTLDEKLQRKLKAEARERSNTIVVNVVLSLIAAVACVLYPPMVVIVGSALIGIAFNKGY